MTMNARRMHCFLCWAASFLLVGGVVFAHPMTDEFRERVRRIYAKCRQMNEPGPERDLIALAKAEGLSREEMAGALVQLVEEGLAENADPGQRSLAHSALWGLVPFGGEKEFLFIRELVSTTKDAKSILRRTGLIVAPRIMPERWEEWLREVVADERSDSYDRFLVCQEAFWIGRDGDAKTRRRVIEVLGEMKRRNLSEADRRDLQGWIDELEALP